MQTDELNKDITELRAELESVIQTRVDLVKMNLCKNTSKLFANITTAIIVSYLGTLVLFFLSIALGLLLGKSLGYIYGFVIIGAAYLVLTVILFLLRKKIIDTPIIQGMIQVFFPTTSNDKDE